MQISGKIVDVIKREIFSGIVEIERGKIINIARTENLNNNQYILPGFIDAHIHIESSMVVPSVFARKAIEHGTVATVSDPHEIANVLGREGVEYMCANGETVPFKFYFGAPSCVPATDFEIAGGRIDVEDLQVLFQKKYCSFLSEMMNFPGVINDFPDVLSKLNIAKEYGVPVDGHAPGLKGRDLKKYAKSGISTDHECTSLSEAVLKIEEGMKILIREGSAAKNYHKLKSLLRTDPNRVMLCSDDLHPDDLMLGHINLLVKRALKDDFDIFDILRAATLNAVEHYSMDVGLLQLHDPADFIVVDNLENLNVKQTYINGELLYDKGQNSIEVNHVEHKNKFLRNPISGQDLKLMVPDRAEKIRIIEVIDGELITNNISKNVETLRNLEYVPDISQKENYLILVNRYDETISPKLAIVKNIGLKKGAIASSIAHDSHNIIAAGTNIPDTVRAVNTVIDSKGGIVAAHKDNCQLLPLPIAGIMSDKRVEDVAAAYKNINTMAKTFGSTLKAPFMTLSFLALLVIPELKLGDKGLFDVNKFEYINIFE